MKSYTNLLKKKIRKLQFQSIFKLPDLEKMDPKVSVLSKENFSIWKGKDHNLSEKIYLISLNMISLFFKYITSFSDLKKLAKEFSKLDSTYMPKGPVVATDESLEFYLFQSMVFI